MGLVDELRGLRICIDTAPFIYFIEKNSKYLGLLRPFFAEINAGKIDAMQIAVGIIYGADAFLTNDSGLKKVKDIRVVILEDFLEK